MNTLFTIKNKNEIVSTCLTVSMVHYLFIEKRADKKNFLIEGSDKSKMNYKEFNKIHSL